VAFAAFTAYQVNALNQSVLEVVSLDSIESVASNESSTMNCKWFPQKCDSGVQREICIVDGNGGACVCGSVTRPC